MTGTHSFKGGIQVTEGLHDIETVQNGSLAYTFLRGAPNGLTQYTTPYRTKMRVMPDLGLFVRDQWVVRRLTLNYGLRFDYFYSYVPAQHVDPTPFVPVARDFPRLSDVPDWKDLNPRLGASYDLFGNGRTAVKVSLGRYVGAASSYLALLNNPINTSVNSVTRTWNDANRNYLPDCDFLNTVANGECGAMSDSNFGRSNITTRYADDILKGLAVRDYLWDLSTEVQHQIGEGLSVTAGYYRNWSNHFSTAGIFNAGVTDNLLVESADYSPYCITAPSDPGLPGGGGYQVCGLYDISPSKFGQVNNLVTRAEDYGGQRLVNDFFGISVNGRFRRGLDLGGGLDTGRIDDRPMLSGRFSPAGALLPRRLAVQRADPGEAIRELPVACPVRRERYVPECRGPGDSGELHGIKRRNRSLARPQSGRVPRRRGVHGNGHGSPGCSADAVREASDGAGPAAEQAAGAWCDTAPGERRRL